MAGDDEGAGAPGRVLIDGKAVRCYHPERTPAADDVDTFEQRKHPHGPFGHAREFGRRRAVVEADVFLAVANLDAAIAGLADAASRQIEKRRDAFADQHLTANGFHRCIKADHRR